MGNAQKNNAQVYEHNGLTSSSFQLYTLCVFNYVHTQKHTIATLHNVNFCNVNKYIHS